MLREGLGRGRFCVIQYCAGSAGQDFQNVWRLGIARRNTLPFNDAVQWHLFAGVGRSVWCELDRNHRCKHCLADIDGYTLPRGFQSVHLPELL